MERTPTRQRTLDVNYYTSKFGVPLWERKWIILLFIILGIVLAFVISSFIRSEYYSSASLFVTQPLTEISKVRQEEVAPEGPSPGYIAAEAEKLRSSSLASEVLQVMPERIASDLKAESEYTSQISQGILDFLENIFGEGRVDFLRPILGRDQEPATERLERLRMLQELQQRLTVRANSRTGVIDLEASAFSQETAPALLSNYIDVYLASNLEENKESVRAKVQFIRRQREQAYLEYKQAEDEMIEYRKEMGIPGDLEQARDISIQLELNRLRSNLNMARERFQMMDRMFVELQGKEAGILNNVKVLSQPSMPTAPIRRRINQLRLVIMLAGLAAGIGLVLLLDFLSSPIRHEHDIEVVSETPVIGVLPQIKA